jgi:hypothetical protein
MICPSCKVETRIQEVKTEYIYPNIFLGMPTFWGFMSPAIARLVTIVIAVLGIIMAVFGTLLLIKGSIAFGISLLLIFAIAIYSVIVGIISLGKYRTKKYFRCLSCRLDWYEYVDGKEH